MKRGMYRIAHEEFGEVARVHWTCGDAAPWLARAIYAASGFQPDFDSLPDRDTFMRDHPWVEEPPI